MAKTNIPEPFNLQITDSFSRSWYFKLSNQPRVSFETQDQFNIIINAEGRKIGDFDEQRDWSGGRGGERLSEDITKYRDARETCTWIPGHAFPSLLKNVSSGYRDKEQSLPGSLSWRGIFGTTRYVSRTITASASSNRLNAWVWLKRVGSPGTCTVELQTSSGGKPTGTALKSATVTTSTITDTVSQFYNFTWAAQAVTSTTVYHLVIYGASTDDTQNHWEVGVDTSGTSSFYKSSQFASDGTTADFSMYYLLTDEDSTTRRWWYFFQGANFCKVSNDTTAKLYKWNESTDLWEVIASGTHGLGQVTGRPIEVNGFVYFPQGDTVAIRTWDGTNWDAQTIATGQGCATGLAVGYSAADNKTQIWRFNNALVSGGTTTGLKVSVSRADAVSTYTTDLAFRNSILVGDTSTTISFIKSINNDLYVSRANSFGVVTNDRYTELDYGQRKTPSTDNGIVIESWNSFIFFNWLSSFERLYSGTVDDVGQGFKNNSFPYGREGVISAFATYVSWMFYVIDAGTTGTSSVMLYDGLNHHEVSRGLFSGRRIRDVFIQPVSGARNRLWFDCGGDSIYIELPYNKGNPLDDTGSKYMHEFVLESSAIDMGTASKLPKLIQDLTVTANNLNGNGIRIDVDVKFDEDVGTAWTVDDNLYKSFKTSPEDSVKIGKSNIRKFSYRLRGQTDNQLVPPDITGIVPSGISRSPRLRILECEAKIQTSTINGKKQKAEDVTNWLDEMSESPILVHVNSKFDSFDDFDAILHMPAQYPIKAVPERDVVVFTLLVL
jgi:hypothetical protein